MQPHTSQRLVQSLQRRLQVTVRALCAGEVQIGLVEENGGRAITSTIKQGASFTVPQVCSRPFQAHHKAMSLITNAGMMIKSQRLRSSERLYTCILLRSTYI
jgi:hypothetical protein